MEPSRETIRAAYEHACRLEIEALKPGNVHRFGAGHGMNADQFVASAEVSSGPLTDPGLPVGARILEAVRATRRAVGINTNLGIILLAAPVARAAELNGDLREDLGAVLGSLTMADAKAVFEAIVLASPGGLGSAETNDVREAPQAPLIEAMRQAADRDSIARQYVTGFADIFDVGLPAIERTSRHGEAGMWPTVSCYMAFLAGFPDSHVARKHGPAVAERLRLDAVVVKERLDEAAGEAERRRLLLEFDRRLKGAGINPGTSADLTVASLLVHSLSCALHRGRVDG
jgi:triphosphoribosyl-dephospho-CoA synthase